MANKQRIFFYDRRELLVLILLALMVALFSFTLGVHLGKRVSDSGKIVHRPQDAHLPPNTKGDSKTVQHEEDESPGRIDLMEQATGNDEALEEGMSAQLHREVLKKGIQLDQSIPVDLPQKANDEMMVKTGDDRQAGDLTGSQPEEKLPAILRKSPAGRYTIQVGSHPSLQEASRQVNSLESAGVEPFLRPVDLDGRGRWYRVYVGGYTSKTKARDIAQKYIDQHLIQSFVLAKMPKTL